MIAGRSSKRSHQLVRICFQQPVQIREHSADGLIKHLVHEKLNTREMCVEAYMQFLKAGEKSGRHRHMWEEIIFVVEGSGYDLHWDLKFDCLDAFQWEWAAEPKAYGWKRGDYIYVPPYTEHQHVASDHEECRLIVMSNRICSTAAARSPNSSTARPRGTSSSERNPTTV